MIDCTPTQKFWKDLEDWCTNHTSISLTNLSVAEKLLGVSSDVKNNNGKERLQNWITLTAKFFIHREKLFGQGCLSLLAYLGEARKKLHMERLACQLEGKTRKFNKFRLLFQALGGQTAAQ